MVQIAVVDEEIPTIDYFYLFSADPVHRSNALDCLSTACEHYGFFNLVNHGVPDGVIEGALSGIAAFFEKTPVEEKSKYKKGDPRARILWDARCHSDENKEHLKLLARPTFHCPPNPPLFRYVFLRWYQSLVWPSGRECLMTMMMNARVFFFFGDVQIGIGRVREESP
ncbi:unnamed protein product [Linum tenue]|uniref:Non-haem dioxygenase N-terminal domain-containing protein n=1 Tax=Linum tenue TaxID=586396 RepID=A0AAV0I4N4_9ROSI|nr:unnamed protein product [Linum tenue]